MLTLFSTPKPFVGHSKVIQMNALRSWKQLFPDVEIILFGADEGSSEACQELGLRHEPHVETNSFSTKRIDYIFRRAQEIARHSFLCYVNCDIILLADFAAAFARVRAAHNKFLMVGRRWDTPITLSCTDFSTSAQQALLSIAQKSGVQQPGHSVDYFAFTRGLYSDMPPLVIGRVWWDHWLVYHARELHVDVVDVSPQVLAIHQNHDYGYHPKGAQGVWNDEQARSNYENAGGKWHLYTIDDATHILDRDSERSNPRRHFAPYWRVLRPQVIPFWHGFLDLTRPVRHKLGLRQGKTT
jgi:hypothetical protein